MTSLYAMLFDDDRYEQEGALTFLYDPMFYGMGPETFSYTRSTLQDAVIKEMESNGWLGACCEPNSIFIVCNQFPVRIFFYYISLSFTNSEPRLSQSDITISERVQRKSKNYWRTINAPRKKRIACLAQTDSWWISTQSSKIKKLPAAVSGSPHGMCNQFPKNLLGAIKLICDMNLGLVR